MIKSKDQEDNIVKIQPANSFFNDKELFQVLISNTKMQSATVVFTGNSKDCLNIAKGYSDSGFHFIIER
jgi:hypothetical protein